VGGSCMGGWGQSVSGIRVQPANERQVAGFVLEEGLGLHGGIWLDARLCLRTHHWY
jgi:hypothetical protein